VDKESTPYLYTINSYRYSHRYISPSMRILILGATSPTGPFLIREALASIPDCNLILYTRSPGKLSQEFVSEPQVKVVTGELNDSDIDNFKEALNRVDAILSLIGPIPPFDKPVAKVYNDIFYVMRKEGVKRIIATGALPIVDEKDQPGIGAKLMVNAAYWFHNDAYNDGVAIGEAFREQGQHLDWTLIRVPSLTDDEGSAAAAGYSGDDNIGNSLTRSALATWMIKELLDPQWIRKLPVVSSV